jgi:hypothetical protein
MNRRRSKRKDVIKLVLYLAGSSLVHAGTAPDQTRSNASENVVKRSPDSS